MEYNEAPKACDCISTHDVILSKNGYQLDISSGGVCLHGTKDSPAMRRTLEPARVHLPCRKKQGDLPSALNPNPLQQYVAASHCPFCGTAYPAVVELESD